ncbi:MULTISPECIES: hypothetical protein, partial [unclassified Rhizobium]|uniref:hypothetical protein n=1 Tax=unclassified Rhizobium TaxID=2613769 RepID=UPI001FFDF5BF
LIHIFTHRFPSMIHTENERFSCSMLRGVALALTFLSTFRMQQCFVPPQDGNPPNRQTPVPEARRVLLELAMRASWQPFPQ